MYKRFLPIRFGILLIIFGFSLIWIQPTYASSDKTKFDSIIISTNSERLRQGLKPLRYNSLLTKSAATRACDMSKKNTWSHNGYVQWIRSYGFKGGDIGENLSRNLTENQAMNAWMNSLTHRDNILQRAYKYIGVGRCDTYIVVHFGTK